MSIPFPDINPIAFTLGPLPPIRWYGIGYVCSIIAAQFYLKHLASFFKMIKSDDIDRIVPWVIIGIIAGGRLGHIIFFEPIHYLTHPIEILHIWKGGMSFHGGLIGVVLATGVFAHRTRTSFLSLSDLIALCIPIGLFIGRITNFINQELYGIRTNLPFGVIFPSVDQYPRHPTQIYEAVYEGLFLGFILYYILRRCAFKPGELSSYFLILYGIGRFLIEFLKESDCTAQILCGGMILLGTGILSVFKYRSRHSF